MKPTITTVEDRLEKIKTKIVGHLETHLESSGQFDLKELESATRIYKNLIDSSGAEDEMSILEGLLERYG